MYLVKTPRLVQALMPAFTWHVPSREKVLYLTFDDGPIPEVTPWVVETLRKYKAKATFFCVGENAKKHPHLLNLLLAEGHALGNHTYNHLNGWHTETLPYLKNIRLCARQVNSKLFRPPYGRITPRQRSFIERHYQIVMWDVLSGDFDKEISPEQCLNNVLNNAQAGSIVVMHDSLKAEKKLRYILPRILEQFNDKGYRFESVPAKSRSNMTSRTMSCRDQTTK